MGDEAQCIYAKPGQKQAEIGANLHIEGRKYPEASIQAVLI